MTTVRHQVDAVIDGTGDLGNELWVQDGRVSLDRPVDPDPFDTVRRPGFLLPGLHDAHIHLASITAATSGVTLEGARDIDEVMRRIAGTGTGDVVAIAFDETEMNPSRLLDADTLDAMVQSRAVLVYRVCGHIAMANTMALQRAGIDRSTADPPGGGLDRDSAGNPTGILRETAIDLVSSVIDDESRDMGDDDLVRSLARLARLGLTSVTAMVPAGAPAWCGPDDELDRLLKLESPMPIRAVLISNTIDDLVGNAGRLKGDRLSFAGWKGFADGSLGGHTAALSEPYRDDGTTSGTARFDEIHFRAMSEAALELGGSVHIHAIGDAAIGRVVDLFTALVEAGADPERLRVEHASVMTPRLIERVSELGVVASVQPAFVRSDARWLDRRLGSDRAKWAYPFRSMRDAGVLMVGGSDAPVESPDPLAGARAAVDRGGWNADEALEPWEALALFADGSFDEASVTWVSQDLDRFERWG